MPPTSALDAIDDKLFQKYGDLIYARTGIRISPQKKTLLANRLRRRLRETGIESFEAYYAQLSRLPASDGEWDGFLQEITTHETYLFRDENQWQWLRQTYLPQLSDEARANKRPKRLRVWSAACSTGDEAYTIACCVVSSLPNYKSWHVQIVGTDIGPGAVAAAKQGVFGERAMKLVPEEYQRAYFTKLENNRWQAKPVLTSLTRFLEHNLLDPLREPAFDLIFLKNVLIYFDPPSKAKVMGHLRQVLLPGGMLIAGGAEGISEWVREFTHPQPWLHVSPMTKPGGGK